MKNFICIVCPNSCHLSIDEQTLTVTGNKCVRGVQFAKSELTNPLRTLTTTMKTTLPGIPVVPVKTSGEISKRLLFEAMKVINQREVNDYLPSGSVVIANILDTQVDIVTTSTLKKE